MDRDLKLTKRLDALEWCRRVDLALRMTGDGVLARFLEVKKRESTGVDDQNPPNVRDNGDLC